MTSRQILQFVGHDYRNGKVQNASIASYSVSKLGAIDVRNFESGCFGGRKCTQIELVNHGAYDGQQRVGHSVQGVFAILDSNDQFYMHLSNVLSQLIEVIVNTARA